tara:strand:+ start:750 stop:1307 length:558 start_codon:yes stop_codon:yes gene_type:complete
MAKSSNYMFNNLTGLGEDQCYLSQTEIQNNGFFNYTVANNNRNMDPTVDLALSNGMNYLGGRNTTGVEGTNVEQSNKVLFGKGTHPHSKLSLRERSYKSVPYLGRGSGNVDVESTLMHGEEHFENKKSLNPLSEESYLQYSNTPLIKDIEEKITNPAYLVEGSHNGWIRGGLPSRELNRDNKINK